MPRTAPTTLAGGGFSPADFRVTNHGSIFLFTPLTEAAEEWVAEHLPEDAPTLGPSYAVEHRYIEAIVEGAQEDGFTVI